eukprot:5513878-Amphidinium_carterae.1
MRVGTHCRSDCNYRLYGALHAELTSIVVNANIASSIQQVHTNASHATSFSRVTSVSDWESPYLATYADTRFVMALVNRTERNRATRSASQLESALGYMHSNVSCRSMRLAFTPRWPILRIPQRSDHSRDRREGFAHNPMSQGSSIQEVCLGQMQEWSATEGQDADAAAIPTSCSEVMMPPPYPPAAVIGSVIWFSPRDNP